MAFFDGTGERAAAKKTATHLTFTVGEQLYAVPMDIVSEVARAGDIAPLSDADDAVIGQTRLRDSAVIVVDMGIRLQGKPVDRKNGYMLVVKRAGARSACLTDKPEGLVSIAYEDALVSGCLVDGAHGAASIPPEDCVSPENASLSGASRGFSMYKEKGKTILLPNREVFFPE